MASILSGRKRGKSVSAGVQDYFHLCVVLNCVYLYNVILKVRSGKVCTVTIKMLFSNTSVCVNFLIKSGSTSAFGL